MSRIRSKRLLTFLILIKTITTFIIPATWAAVNKSGLKPSVISLPTGPASIEGLGESFEPQLNNGTFKYSFAVKVPPGVNGLEPSVSISYDAGFGSGLFGLGWNIGIPFIQRQRDKGLPRYDDANMADTFVYANGEELVPLADYSFRTENESSFRYFKIRGNHWEMKARDGTLYRFGLYPNGANPGRQSRVYRNDPSFTETFRWYVDEIIDTQGNRIEYLYRSFSDSPGMLYCSEIRYCIIGTSYKAVLFEYETRPDRFTNYRSRFPITIGRRCSIIRVISFIKGVKRQVRRYRFIYQREEGKAPGCEQAFTILYRIMQYDCHEDKDNYLPPLRFEYTPFNPTGLSAITIQNPPPNSLYEQNMEIVDINGDSLADFVYTPQNCGRNEYIHYLNTGRDGFAQGRPFAYSPAGVSLESPAVRLADYNGDGLCDLVVKYPERFGYYPNLSKVLEDGTDEMAWGEDFIYYDVSPSFLSHAEDDKNCRMMDLDFDRKTDFMYTNASGVIYYYNRSGFFNQGGHWEDSNIIYWGDPRLGDMTASEVRFAQVEENKVVSNPYIVICDMNGDHLQDIVKLSINASRLTISYWPNKGFGEWANRVYPDGDMDIGAARINDILVFDINADGLSDIVRVGNNTIYYWVNLGDNSFSPPFIVTGMPEYYPGETVLRQGDMNGNGTRDLIWENRQAAQNRLRYYDFVGSVKPYLLSVIDNGVGKRIYIDYKTSTQYYVEAKVKGNPWKLRLPFATYVISSTRITPSIDLDQDGQPDTYETEFLYRDGYYDSFEREFRGFSFVKKREVGDSLFPTTVTRYSFHTGAPDGRDNDNDGKTDEWSEEAGWEDEPLKGGLLWGEVTGESYARDGEMAPDDIVFTRIINDLALKNIHTPKVGNPTIPYPTINGKSVVFPYMGKTTTQVIERQPSLKKELAVCFIYDNFGNLILEENYGEVQEGTIADDETFSHTDYIINTDHWIINRLFRSWQTDETGAFVTERRFYYDGDDYVGLPLGEIGPTGNLTRKEVREKEGGRFINIARNAYDSYGNVVSMLDANGHKRAIIYDSVFHNLPEGVIYYREEEKDPFQISAEYDKVFDVVIHYTDFNGHKTYYRHDSFGRLTKIIEPGDSEEYPSVEFYHAVADPYRGLIYEFTHKGDLSIKVSSKQPLLSRIVTKNREEFGQEGTLDVVQYVDGLGRKLAEIGEGEESGKFVVNSVRTFNKRGSVKKSYLPYLQTSTEYLIPGKGNYCIEHFFDAAGREIRYITPPDSDHRRFTGRVEYFPLKKLIYDEEDNDPNSIHYDTPITVIYDGLQRILKVQEKNRDDHGLSTYTTRYKWNLLNKLIEVVDNQNNVKCNNFDALGRLLSSEDPDRGLTQYEYDYVGNLLQSTDNKGQVIEYAYDALDRLISEDYIDGNFISPDISYHYDEPAPEHQEAENLTGFLSYVYDQSGAEYNSYDIRGNNTWIIKRVKGFTKGPNEFRTDMDYDSLGRLKRLTYPDGEYIDHQYNPRSLLEQIPDIIEHISYTASGNTSGIVYSNGVKSEYEYDPMQRPTQMRANNSRGVELQDMLYRFGAVGNILSIEDNRDSRDSASQQYRTQHFAYDDLYRLVSAKGLGYGEIGYKYDSIGNMIHKGSPEKGQPGHIEDKIINTGLMASGGERGSYNRGLKGQGDSPGPNAVTETENGFIYEYGDNGNMIRKVDTIQNIETGFRYDFKNRLTKIEMEQKDINVEFVYDYLDQRVIKKVDMNGMKEETFYINGNYEIRNNEHLKYISFKGKRIAMIKGKIHEEMSHTQEISLKKGWNFISLYVEPEDPSISSIASTISDADIRIFSYDNENNRFLTWSGAHKELTELHSKEGYLVHVDKDCTLSVTGRLSQWGREVRQGWNMVGFNITGPSEITNLISPLDSQYVSVWGFDNLFQKWGFFSEDGMIPAFLKNLTIAEPGLGYWINTNVATSIRADRPDDFKIFYVTDHLGSTNIATDLHGEILEIIEYYPFGHMRYHKSLEDISPHKFTNQEFDPETGLYNYNFRLYDPVLCRFISPDNIVPRPFDPQSLNRYSYCRNNPIMFIDPTGHGWEDWNSLDDITGQAESGVSTFMDDWLGIEQISTGLFVFLGFDLGLDFRYDNIDAWGGIGVGVGVYCSVSFPGFDVGAGGAESAVIGYHTGAGAYASVSYFAGIGAGYVSASARYYFSSGEYQLSAGLSYGIGGVNIGYSRSGGLSAGAGAFGFGASYGFSSGRLRASINPVAFYGSFVQKGETTPRGERYDPEKGYAGPGKSGNFFEWIIPELWFKEPSFGHDERYSLGTGIAGYHYANNQYFVEMMASVLSYAGNASDYAKPFILIGGALTAPLYYTAVTIGGVIPYTMATP